ncbi:disease resistance protein RPV1-like isoform X2 [Alnus glutinosa]|uniref:disease resistance protein RPV1-like isoform X2 n=1 Tax=Alnus glutinosa TaxID=3517 RepID=UPI002D7789E1|nr:disease resistance protein RPV1-like isoform X2 [Alnus glutinosa]
MAAQTLSSSSEPRWNRDVFLSFRGEDTRKTFTDHLYTALLHAGIHTFRDDEELPRGNHISTELLKAIQGSKVSIVVFSKGYASSSWCLDELVEILHCKNTMGQTFLPIFYDVNPSDVRRQTRSFAEAFFKHEEQFQAEMERVRKWRASLTEAANYSGWDIQNVANGYESRLIEKIVEEVSHKVNNACLNIAKHPISINYRTEKMKALLNLGTRSDVRIVGIYGMGGIGKTTLAKAIYNQIYNGFEGSTCLLDIKETEHRYGLVHLQEQLLSDVLKTKDLKIANVDRGINLIKERFRCKRVLVILDDVDHLKQLNSLAGSSEWFGPGSRIILTTRDEYLLTKLGVHEKYKVEEFNHEESLQLFSWHAFRMAHPIEDYRELSISVVNYVGGLPLALEILGSSLLGRSTIEWKAALEKLQKHPHHEIQKILRMSFDSLDDDTVKDTFLDIACFFVGMDKDYAIKIFNGCGFFPDIGINILIERSLVTINAKNELRMHDLIRDMGREVVHEMSPKDPGKRSRLWFHEDVLDVLNKHLVLNKLKVLNLKGSKCLTQSPNFLALPHLEILILKGCTSLVEVHESIGHLEKLVLLNLQGCKNLKNLPESISNLYSLETLNLSGCIKIDKLPKHLGNIIALTELLANGTAFRKLPHFFWFFNQLKIVSLSGCKAQSSRSWMSSFLSWISPKCKKPINLLRISGLCCLTDLNLGGCNLFEDEIPMAFGSLSSLKNLDLSRNKFCSLPRCIGGLPKLDHLLLHGCTSLQSISELPASLVHLYAEGCSSLQRLPNVSNQESLHTSFYMDNCYSLAYDFRKSLLQYLSNCGDRYRYIELPGGEVPNWFSHKRNGSNSISLQMPSLPKGQIKGLFLCAVWSPEEQTGLNGVSYAPLNININNRPSGITQVIPVNFDSNVYSRNSFGDHSCIMYIPNPFTGAEIASGMEMNIDFDLHGLWELNQCGIHLHVDEPNAIMDSKYSLDMVSAKRGRDHDNEAGSSVSDENCQKRSRIVDSEA